MADPHTKEDFRFIMLIWPSDNIGRSQTLIQHHLCHRPCAEVHASDVSGNGKQETHALSDHEGTSRCDSAVL
jgi:hypothetical protein